MPKPLLTRPETRNLTGTTLSTAPIQQQKLQTQQMNKMELDRYLRKKRSKDYIQTMCELDIGGHVQNQQKVLEAMLNKMMSPAIITNYSSILDHIDGCFETNMTSDEITSLIKMQLSDMSSWDIQQIQLQGHGAMLTGGAYMPGNRLYYMIPDEDSVSQCIAQIKEVQENH